MTGTGSLFAGALLSSKRVGGKELRELVRDYNEGLARSYGITNPKRVFPEASPRA